MEQEADIAMEGKIQGSGIPDWGGHCLSCGDEVPQTAWLNRWQPISSCAGGWRSKIKASAGWSLPGLICMVVHFWLSIDPSCTVTIKYLKPGSLLTLGFHFLLVLEAEKLNQGTSNC